LLPAAALDNAVVITIKAKEAPSSGEYCQSASSLSG
jgi:hypothetical protein